MNLIIRQKAYRSLSRDRHQQHSITIGEEVRGKMSDKQEDKKLTEYETPQVITYTDEEIIEELGPAQAINYGLGDGPMG